MHAFFSKPPITSVKVSDVQFDTAHPRFGTDIEDLVESIQTVGMIQPVVLNQYMKLIAGKRRLAAAKKLGLVEIPAHVLSLDQLSEELVAIDENIIRMPLNSVEYDDAMYRRKVIFEERHPDTRAGYAGRAESETPSFTEETAKKLDLSRKSIELAVNRSRLATVKVREARMAGLSPSKVNEIVTLDPTLQDEILPIVGDKSYSEVKDLVKRIKTGGLEQTLSALREVPALSFADALDRELLRVQRELNAILQFRGSLNISGKDKVVKRTRGVMRLMRAFLGRVRVESKNETHETSSTPSADREAGL